MSQTALTMLADDEQGKVAALVMGTVVMAVSGVVLMVVGRRSRDGKLAPNVNVGIRTRRTLESDHAWEVMHRVAGPWTIYGGVAMLAVAPAFAVFHDRPEIGATVVLAGCAVMMGLLVYGAHLGNKEIDRQEAAAAADRTPDITADATADITGRSPGGDAGRTERA